MIKIAISEYPIFDQFPWGHASRPDSFRIVLHTMPFAMTWFISLILIHYYYNNITCLQNSLNRNTIPSNKSTIRTLITIIIVHNVMEVNYVCIIITQQFLIIAYSTFLTICTCIYSLVIQVIKTNILLSFDTISRPDQLIKNF